MNASHAIVNRKDKDKDFMWIGAHMGKDLEASETVLTIDRIEGNSVYLNRPGIQSTCLKFDIYELDLVESFSGTKRITFFGSTLTPERLTVENVSDVFESDEYIKFTHTVTRQVFEEKCCSTIMKKNINEVTYHYEDRDIVKRF